MRKQSVFTFISFSDDSDAVRCSEEPRSDWSTSGTNSFCAGSGITRRSVWGFTQSQIRQQERDAPVQVRRCVRRDGSDAPVHSGWCWTSERCCSECPSVPPEQLNTSNISGVLKRWAVLVQSDQLTVNSTVPGGLLFSFLVWLHGLLSSSERKDSLSKTFRRCFYLNWITSCWERYWMNDTDTYFTHNPSLSENTLFYCTIMISLGIWLRIRFLKILEQNEVTNIYKKKTNK